MHIAILLFPLFLLFFPQYIQAENAFKLITLTVVLYTNSFGYSGYLIAKGYEKKLAGISFFALMLNIAIAFVLSKIFKVPFQFVISATLVTYLIYVFILGRKAREMLKLSSSLFSVLKIFIPIVLLFHL
jgi:O-antigen/teichoic acid export membrane protein